MSLFRTKVSKDEWLRIEAEVTHERRRAAAEAERDREERRRWQEEAARKEDRRQESIRIDQWRERKTELFRVGMRNATRHLQPGGWFA